MKRKIWNQFTTAVLTTVIGTTMSIVSSAEASFGSPLNDLIVSGQSTPEPTVQSIIENQSTTVDTHNNFAPSQANDNSKPILENSEVLPASPTVFKQETFKQETFKQETFKQETFKQETQIEPTNQAVPVTQPQPMQAAETTPTSNINVAPAKKTQPTRINPTTVKPKPSAKVSRRPQTAQQTKGRVTARKGMASWYGPGFQGRRTANGERFNPHGMTAAHRSLPLGTNVKVTNLNNGRSVVVRINDRGPFGGGRIIDLSQGAARLIGVVQSGVAPVLLEVLGR